jgi:sugar diacid utilization regulator
MIPIKHGYITEELFEAYLDSLVGSFFKIMQMRDKDEPTLKTYLNSLNRELAGNESLILCLNNNAYFMQLMGTVQFFIDNDVDKKTCASDVKKCINTINKLKKKLLSGVNK